MIQLEQTMEEFFTGVPALKKVYFRFVTNLDQDTILKIADGLKMYYSNKYPGLPVDTIDKMVVRTMEDGAIPETQPNRSLSTKAEISLSRSL
jgi:hypothetical protein